MDTTDYDRTLIRQALTLAAEYWRDRGDDNFTDLDATTQDKCYQKAAEFRELLTEYED